MLSRHVPKIWNCQTLDKGDWTVKNVNDHNALFHLWTVTFGPICNTFQEAGFQRCNQCITLPLHFIIGKNKPSVHSSYKNIY